MQEDTTTEQAPVAVGNAGGDDNTEGQTNFVDQVCDPCGFIPPNLEEALAHKKKMKLMKDQEEEAAKNDVPVVDNPEEKIDADADANAVDGMFSNFDMDCCGQAPVASDEVEVTQVPEEQLLKYEDNDYVMTGNSSYQSRSIAEIAAKIDDIDLETAAEDITGDQISEGDDNSINRLGKGQPWYKQPLYASLIILCGSFSIAIIVMAILLIVNKK